MVAAAALGGGGGGGSFDAGLNNADLIQVAGENHGNGLWSITPLIAPPTLTKTVLSETVAEGQTTPNLYGQILANVQDAAPITSP